MRKLTIALLLLLPLPAFCEGWWNSDWNFRKEITLDLTPTGANIAGSASDVPVVIRLHAGNFPYFSDAKPDGSDLRFVDSDGKTPLKFHVEHFDSTNQLAFVWVRVPRLTGATNSQKIFLYYGNPKVSAGSDAPGTYDKSQALVLHFDAAQPVDFTAYGNKPSASTAEWTGASLISGGIKLNGSQSITIPAGPALRYVPASGATMSAWVRTSAAQADSYALSLQEGANEFVLGLRGARPFARLAGGAVTEAAGPADLETDKWHHLAVTAGTGKLILYVDGAAVTSVPLKQSVEIAGQFSIGAAANGSHGMTGEMDEVQFSDVVRPAEALQAASRSQGVEAPLVVYGGDSQRETQKVSYFKTTLQNVTPDGWVVIVLLAVMMVIALLVMIGKALYLSQVHKANTRFIAEFEKLRGDPTALDHEEADDGDAALDESAFMPHLKGGQDEFRMSTIYRLYHHGVQEMSGRVRLKSAGASATTALSPQAIAAMRATMDATMVRMGQKLSSNMVLLTIAIAGGPFLGLLGTVVGVMITFAAIAASGDVNVNAIAPGIAAALVATVAGLAVAIPALFGYNWLNTRIKNINADMRVFVDEFVTRVAEHYS